MKNRYLQKLATIIDMGPDGEIRKIGPADFETEARIRNAKRIKPPISQTLKPVGERALRITKKMAIPAAVAAGVATGVYTAAKSFKSHEKSADLISPEHKKEMAQTGVLVGSGIATAGALDRFVKPRMNFHGLAGKAKYIGLIGGANLAADYGAVKINKAIEHNKQAQIDIKPSHQGLLHKKLGIPQDEKINSSELAEAKAKAKSTGNSKLMKQVVFAQNAKKWHHE